MLVGDPWFPLGCTELDVIKSKKSTVKNAPEVNDADRNDRHGAARADDAAHNVRVGSKRERDYEV